MRILFLLCCLTTICSAQSVPIGSRSMALGGQATVITDNAGTVFFNPSLLLALPKLSVWSNYYRPFGLAEIRVQAFALNYTGKRLGTGIGVLTYGNALFRDQMFVLPIAGKLSSRLIIGGKIKLRRVAVQNYGAASNLALDIGLLTPINEQIGIGFLLKNVAKTGLGASNEKPATEARSAIAFKLHDRGSLFLELVQEDHFQPLYRLAAEIAVASWFQARVGTGINTPEAFAAGFGLNFSRLRVDYALQHHPLLEQTHVFAIAIEVQR